MPEEYISTKDAAAQLGYTVQHTRLLIREGKLQAQKFGRDWLVVREAVAEYGTNAEPGDDHLDSADARNTEASAAMEKV